MELGGLHHQRERVFLLSTTHGAEGHALAAAIATMKIYEEEPVIAHLERQGTRLAAGLKEVIAARGLEGHVGVFGKPCNLVYFTRDAERKDSQYFRALLLQELIKAGVIAPSLVVSYSHSDVDIDRTVAAFDSALAVYRRALDEGVERYLVGGPTKSVYRAYN
jgi:glutamate-1-semialdehyde 2,1-aminomutase